MKTLPKDEAENTKKNDALECEAEYFYYDDEDDNYDVTYGAPRIKYNGYYPERGEYDDRYR